ncbi:putative flavin-containing monooxygenase 1 [Dichanthelium oligosanthes]|uniref:Flavin-containing monooxygenase n=1 Tax=Dichanthelium oligosanthes TaxID=888268 RepID=A0A1E5VWK1_9POAL|nr:putative flavin-containing monooxygenase 1 [Dichanthelium oligosanthes]
MDAKKKRVAIVGAGPSGLAACKHALAKGFRPVVFESAAGVGGVWRRTLASTRLQTPASTYRFSDFPWPASADAASTEGLFPRHDQVLEYLAAYARRFGVLDRVRFGCKVLGASYVGATETEVAAWEWWSGNGEAFGDGTGEWHLNVRHGGGGGDGEPESTQTYRFDFLILCIGRYSIAKFPTFPLGRGPEVFRGRVLHSKEYSTMAHEDAAELIMGKRVAVVGAGKSAMDTVAQCAEANGSRYPCTMVYRSAHWMVDPKVARRVKFFTFTSTRLTELMVHKPGEGFALSLLATMLTPLRWVMSKVTEAYYKRSIPMREHGMVPDCGFGQASLGWRLGILPEGFYDRVDEGSVELRRCSSVGFCPDGLVLDGGDDGERERVVGADVVILSTGFDIDRPLRDVFTSPWFSEMIVAAGSSSDDGVLPLYRHCVHPRIPQMAVVGYAESGSSVYPYEMMAKWVAHLLDGAVRLPGVRDMERGVAEWARWGRLARRSCGGFFLKSCIASVTTWYHDQLCRDMGYSSRRKDGLLAEWLQPYGPTDYASIQ